MNKKLSNFVGMNNPFDYRPDEAAREAFAGLLERIALLKASERPEDVNFCRELEHGKMLGVLVAADEHGKRRVLYAFSGQPGHGGFFHEGFVEPVMDYLQPDGHFKTKEAEISQLNREIARFEAEELARRTDDYNAARKATETEVEQFREKCRESKARRDARRQEGGLSDAEMAEMTRRSQFEKAELRRLKQRGAEALHPLAEALREARARLEALKNRRRSESEALQNWLFSAMKLLNARGESRSVAEIFAETPLRVAPSGAGECCAPKLLQAAYRRGLHPLSIAEYWYGKPKGGEVRIHGNHYPACRGKCMPILNWMLQGLEVNPPLEATAKVSASGSPEILFENQWLCIVDKPSGMLSVPGKGAESSVQSWLEERYGPECCVKLAHRLDQDTSGLLVATFGEAAFKLMQKLFATRRVAKTYVAVLDGDYRKHGIASEGRICLPLAPDRLDRPRQRVDFNEGKETVTEYRFESVADGKSRVVFHPITGRTHQLRVHAASPLGLGMPIAGDRLYGRAAERMLLHAHRIEFTFPIGHQSYSFESPTPF